eukprot:CAMPEP_0170622628 /NCGR_PEP_ID=MMETSP0224-20130122/29236_1 /TAXON_ID=285029 /ORGANISM="Togula jolla, Strain CCCM 725" /LENGTH=56 /DNA_ID=CAMNT_0010948967 /DNA_START=65 /DNA_END=231 /DNA_ORIENTATION=+
MTQSRVLPCLVAVVMCVALLRSMVVPTAEQQAFATLSLHQRCSALSSGAAAALAGA